MSYARQACGDTRGAVRPPFPSSVSQHRHTTRDAGWRYGRSKLRERALEAKSRVWGDAAGADERLLSCVLRFNDAPASSFVLLLLLLSLLFMLQLA